MLIAWLVRADLRKGDSAGSPISDWFKIWWLINGQREYPGWVNVSELRNANLFEPQPGSLMFNGFGMNSALRFLLDLREDLKEAFDVDTEDGMLNALAWLYIHGIREHNLAPALDEKTISLLDNVPSFYRNSDNTNVAMPELTWLMYFVWKNNSRLQANFELQNEHDKQAYITWFLLDGVRQLQLSPLLASRWRDWLREPVLTSDTGTTVPRAVYLLWQRHEQLQRAFDLRTNIGITGLSMWGREVWQTQAELSWIDSVETTHAQSGLSTKNRPFGVNLIGFAFGELGIGEDVRMAAAVCESVGIPYTVVNINPGSNASQADRALAVHVATASTQSDIAPYACNIFCLTAFDTARIFLEQGELFGGRYNIGWWPWELPVWPSNWQSAFDLVDEVWAATGFTYAMYSEAVVRSNPPYIPVTLMPMAASVERVKPMTREALDLETDSFLFLYVFDFNSYLARKNPIAAVKAFQLAFSEQDSSVGLVLKTMNANPANPEWTQFLDECAQDKRITVIDRTMERGEVLGLIKACDGYLSLHRAEGFGRTLAEAMLFGRAVVSTDFSGNTDFVREGTGYPVKWSKTSVKVGDYPFITSEDDAWWAEPDIKSAALQMRKSRSRALIPYTRDLDTRTVNRIAEARFSAENVGAAVRTRLQEIFSQE